MNKKIRILYIDDYALDRELVRDSLEKEHGGFEVTEASSRRELEALLETHRFDVVLSDFNIAGFEGLQVLEIVRASDSRIPVIIVTGTGSEEIAVKALKLGASDYVIKRPRNIQRLPQTILAAIEKRKLRDQRKEAEASLMESEERFRNIAETSLVGIYILQDSVFKYVNPKFAEIFGYSVEECLDDMHFGRLVSPEDFENVKEQIRRRIAGETKSVQYAFRGIRKDGALIHIEIFGSSILLNGKPATTGTMLDITARKQMEIRLQQAYKMEAVGNLAGGIAHDFNNILSSILGYTELALDDVDKGTALENNLQEVYTAGKRARDLVKQILAFSRQSDDERKPIQVGTIVKEALKLIHSTTPVSIEIDQKISSKSLILGNATQVHQLLLNLCTNAVQAMEGTGGVMGVELTDVNLDADSILTQSGLSPGRYLNLTVSDTGPGISPDIIGSIFEPYFTTKGIGEGTGMGLALAHGIVDAYGGKITVDSEVGKGTVFSVYLPITETRGYDRQYAEEKLPSGTERILLVDDELPIVKVSCQLLEGLGYRVTARTGSVEALELFRAKPAEFDLVITDMTMPNMTGDALSIELLKIRSDIPIILCTGYSKTISDETASGLGIKALAYKPIVKADLAKTVRKVLDGNI